MTAIWLIVMQWLSAALGGYITGRLRTKWVNTHSDEVFFRDTAHGFVTWAPQQWWAPLSGVGSGNRYGEGPSSAASVTSSATKGVATSLGDSVTPYDVDRLLNPAATKNVSEAGQKANEPILTRGSARETYPLRTVTT